MHNVKEPGAVDPAAYSARAEDHRYVERLTSGGPRRGR
jgi:hypothetical protein